MMWQCESSTRHCCTSAWGNSCLDSQCLSGSHTPSCFWCWFWRIPALAWVTGSVKQVFFKLLSGNVNRISPHLSLLVVVHWNTSSDARSSGMVGLCRYSTTNLLHFLLSVLSSWMIHTTKNQIWMHLQSSGLTEHLLPTFVGVLGSPFARCSVTLWGWWGNEWNQSMEPTQQLLGLLLQFQSIQGKCKREKPRTQSLKVCVYSAERLMLKSLSMLSLKQVRLMFANPVQRYSVMLTIVLLTPISITCPQCLFMLVLCSDR